jgi:hypothetical protein
MGQVFRARDTRLGREVAIKVSSARFSYRGIPGQPLYGDASGRGGRGFRRAGAGQLQVRGKSLRAVGENREA